MAVYSKFVGMDVHKETIVVSVAEPFGGEVRFLGEFRNTPEAVVKLINRRNAVRSAPHALPKKRPSHP